MTTKSTAENTKIKVFLIDTKKREAGVKEINCDFESYEEAIHANYYTVVGIKIEDQEFTCIVDEEGLLKKNLVPSIISTDNAPTNPQTLLRSLVAVLFATLRKPMMERLKLA